MKNKLFNNIFSEKAPISRGELDSHIELGDKIEFSIAVKAIDSPFESDALEGFQNTGLTTGAMSGLDQVMSQRYSLGETGLFERWFLSAWSLAFTLLICAPLLLVDGSDQKGNVPIKSPIVLNENEGSPQTHSINDFDISETPQDHDRFVVEFKNPAQSNSQIDKTNSSASNTAATDKKEDVPVRMDLKTAELIFAREKDYQIKKPKAKETALANYIFIDFRGIRNKNTLQLELPISGTGADLSHSDAKRDFIDTESNVNEVDYHEYLEQTAYLMQQNNFKQAYTRFQTILKHYPTDENALFYGAYCLFQLKQYQESLVSLEALKKSAYGNFDEERDWYMLKCYQKLNRNSEAERMAEKIVNQEGFYSIQAREFLKTR